MGKRSVKYALVFLLYCFACIICLADTDKKNGFDVEIWNKEVYGVFYDKMYTNLNDAYLLRLTAESADSVRYFGSGSKSFTVQTSVLVPVNVANHVKLFSICSEAPEVMANMWRSFLESFSFPNAFYDIHQSIAIVPYSSSNNNELSTRYDLTCLINSIQSYRTLSHPKLPSIDVIVINGENIVRKVQLNTNVPQYDNYIYSNLTTLVYESGNQQWNDVLEKARFNEKRWQNDYIFPVYAVETRNQMFLLSASNDCLSSSRKTCQPLGGWSVWATTGNSSWSWNDARHSFERKTAKGAVALMVPLTTASFGHFPAPGADSPASAITAALAITETLKRQDPNVEVSVFFLVGEYIGGIGSSRFIQDASPELACEALGIESCLKLAYKSNLNFTSVNFSNFGIVVALDQLSYSDSPLYFHVDQRIDQTSNTALKYAENLLRNMQIQKAKTNFLYASPVTTYIDFLETNNLLSGVNKTIVTLSRYNEFYNNPHVFTPSDTPLTNKQLNVESIIEASNVILRVILGNDTRTKVDNDLLQRLWYCFSLNFSCDFLNISLNLSSSTPDYATNMFEESYSDATVMVATALSKIGMRPTYTAAISPRLQIREKWGLPWERSEGINHFNSSRYSLFVGSLFNKGNGARTVMLTSASMGTYVFFSGTFMCGLLLFAAYHL